MSSSHYTHGSSEAEQQRLTALNKRLNQRCLDAAQLVVGERVVDFGAGLGQFSRMMARATGVPVLALERSPEQIAEALRQADADGDLAFLEMRRGDVLAPLLTDNEPTTSLDSSTLLMRGSFSSTYLTRCCLCATWPAQCDRADG
ncbi:class I SAM-dependent methyltransferase [Mesorhizobium sp. M0159]|uniref:SAM-dependent methyltransferase n=1 Tax=Mesorhizobium sp. M0159 TaxID=2956900 RepID=UPI0033361CF9